MVHGALWCVPGRVAGHVQVVEILNGPRQCVVHRLLACHWITMDGGEAYSSNSVEVVRCLQI